MSAQYFPLKLIKASNFWMEKEHDSNNERQQNKCNEKKNLITTHARTHTANHISKNETKTWKVKCDDDLKIELQRNPVKFSQVANVLVSSLEEHEWAVSAMFKQAWMFVFEFVCSLSWVFFCISFVRSYVVLHSSCF